QPVPLQAGLLPCGVQDASGGCTLDPAQIQVDVPNSNGFPAVQVSWVPGGDRPAAAPAPSSGTVMLTVGSGSAGPVECRSPAPAPSGYTAYCWAWPSGLFFQSGGDNWILNGGYTVTACQSANPPCTASSQYSPSPTTIAVPPSPPPHVGAVDSNGTVTVSWGAGPEPDLVGYTVIRNDRAIYSCSIDGAGPGAGTACATPLALRDMPGNGSWTYGVESLRFGIDASAAHAVPSKPSSATLTVSPPATGPGSGSGQGAGSGSKTRGSAALPPLPALGVMPPANQGSRGGAGASASSQADAEESGGTGVATPGALAYGSGDNPAAGASLASGSAQPARAAPPNVDSAAELALAIIALALAAHVWYVRGELRVASARVAARRAVASPGATITTSTGGH
ncbi:MAG TPA: hypothetical protein VNG12_06540, partial [Acidimicrobiales bacterium]|nr:hypothetical protein [Acidimicrobiales bacterium]